MKTNKSKKSVWSTDDLHEYLDEAVHSFKVGEQSLWPQMLTILTSGDKDGDSEVLEFAHLPTSLEVTRRVQIVRQYLMNIPRRRLAGGSDGKTIIPAKTVLQQLSDILKTPTILAGVISPAAAAPKVDAGKSTAGHKEEEEESNAGGPAEGNDAEAQASAASKALADALATAARAEAQADAAKEKALTQATQVQKQTQPEVPLESDAEKVQPEDQLGSTAKEAAPAVTVDMAALMAMMQSMQQDSATRLSTMQAQLQSQLTDQRRELGTELENLATASASRSKNNWRF